MMTCGVTYSLTLCRCFQALFYIIHKEDLQCPCKSRVFISPLHPTIPTPQVPQVQIPHRRLCSLYFFSWNSYMLVVSSSSSSYPSFEMTLPGYPSSWLPTSTQPGILGWLFSPCPGCPVTHTILHTHTEEQRKAAQIPSSQNLGY